MGPSQSRSERRSHHVGDLAEAHLGEMPQHDHLSFADRQPLDGLLEPVDLFGPGHHLSGVTHRPVRQTGEQARVVIPVILINNRGPRSPSSTYAITDQIGGNPEQPGIKSPVMLVLANPPDQPDEQILEQIVGIVPPAGKPVEIPIQPVAVGLDEDVECGSIPLLGPGDHLGNSFGFHEHVSLGYQRT